MTYLLKALNQVWRFDETVIAPGWRDGLSKERHSVVAFIFEYYSKITS
jgi:hypothetical protein